MFQLVGTNLCFLGLPVCVIARHLGVHQASSKSVFVWVSYSCLGLMNVLSTRAGNYDKLADIDQLSSDRPRLYADNIVSRMWICMCVVPPVE